MAKKAPAGKSKPHKRLPPITGIGRQIVDYVINSSVFGQYPACCSVDDLATEFKRQPNRFLPTIKRLVKAGWLETHGELLEMVYPTAAALRHQDRNLSQAEAEKIVRQLKRKR